MTCRDIHGILFRATTPPFFGQTSVGEGNNNFGFSDLEVVEKADGRQRNGDGRHILL